MGLPLLIFWLAFGGFLAWATERLGKSVPRWVSMITLVTHMAGLIYLWVLFPSLQAQANGRWVIQFSAPWIPQWGISFYLALDGVSLLLILLSNFLGIMAVVASWSGIQYRIGFFHFNLLWILAAIVGIFLAEDLFLFYFFWEMMLIPLYFLIGIWGHENRVYATLKFFIFTQASGLFMLLAIIGLHVVHGEATGVYTFNYNELLNTPMPPLTATLLMLGFFLAFAVKLPLFPLHTWLPDAHTEAPTAGSVDLAGLVLKVGAYGFLRILIPLFPQAAFNFAPIAMGLAVVGILYGAIVAYGQTDLKRLVAYTSISHMGFVLLGIFAWNQLALQGAMIVMLAHGVTTGAMFILVGDMGDRMHTRDLTKMGGLWPVIPRTGGFTQYFSVATLGLPGLGNFVGEILVLMGAWRVSPALTAVATLGFIFSTVYALWMVQAAFFGENVHHWQLPRSTPRELGIMAVMAVTILWLGLYPQPFLNTAQQALRALQSGAPRPGQASVQELGIVMPER
jgi:NADH-quinone oxidoreductase subunit M